MRRLEAREACAATEALADRGPGECLGMATAAMGGDRADPVDAGHPVREPHAGGGDGGVVDVADESLHVGRVQARERRERVLHQRGLELKIGNVGGDRHGDVIASRLLARDGADLEAGWRAARARVVGEDHVRHGNQIDESAGAKCACERRVGVRTGPDRERPAPGVELGDGGDERPGVDPVPDHGHVVPRRRVRPSHHRERRCLEKLARARRAADLAIHLPGVQVDESEERVAFERGCVHESASTTPA